jgi:hypothetical protein
MCVLKFFYSLSLGTMCPAPCALGKDLADPLFRQSELFTDFLESFAITAKRGHFIGTLLTGCHRR